MAMLLTALCTECSTIQEIEITREKEKIRCKVCSHEVPMFDEEEFGEMRATKKSQTTHVFISLFAFALMAALFAGFCVNLEKDPKSAVNYVFLLGAVISLALSIWQASLAENRVIACEF